MTSVHIQQGDLTAFAADAVVNAANNELILGGGLAGAIARRGGPGIQQECDAHGPIRVGQAAITRAGLLPAKYVIHQASMSLGGKTTPQGLRQSTRAALRIAEETPDIRTVAFPAVGTGIAGFDTKSCAEIMLEEVQAHLARGSKLTDVHFVLFDGPTCQAFRRVWEEMSGRK